MILAGRNQRRNPCEVRSSLSQFPPGRTSLQPTGQKTATRSSYADARFVNRSRSSVTDAGASRHTTSITTGLASAVDAAPSAGGHSHSFHCSLCPYTHYSLPARCQALQRRFAEQCSWEKALPKLKDSNRLPDPSAVRRWVKWAGLFPVGSFLSQPDRYSCGPLAGSRASVC